MHLILHNSAHFDNVVIATVPSEYGDRAPLYWRAAFWSAWPVWKSAAPPGWVTRRSTG